MQVLSLKGNGFISGKLPMTEDEGHMFVVYTVIVMVHMKYIMMHEYDNSVQMLNAMLVAINTIRVHTYIQNMNICVLFYLLDGYMHANLGLGVYAHTHTWNSFVIWLHHSIYSGTSFIWTPRS